MKNTPIFIALGQLCSCANIIIPYHSVELLLIGQGLLQLIGFFKQFFWISCLAGLVGSVPAYQSQGCEFKPTKEASNLVAGVDCLYMPSLGGMLNIVCQISRMAHFTTVASLMIVVASQINISLARQNMLVTVPFLKQVSQPHKKTLRKVHCAEQFAPVQVTFCRKFPSCIFHLYCCMICTREQSWGINLNCLICAPREPVLRWELIYIHSTLTESALCIFLVHFFSVQTDWHAQTGIVTARL